MWSIRPRRQARGAMAAGGGDLVVDFAHPEPDPPPVTTIAWRLGHISVGIFGARNASHFDGPTLDYLTVDWSATAAGALDLLDEVYDAWVAGVRGLDEEALARPVGPAEGDYADLSHPPSCSTSTGRPSTTWPRSPSYETCTGRCTDPWWTRRSAWKAAPERPTTRGRS